VDQCHRGSIIFERVADRRPDQTLGPRLGNRFDAEAAVRPDIPAVCFVEERKQFLGVFGACFELLSGIDVLGVLPEDHHVDELRVLDRGGHSLEPAHRPQTDIQIHYLPQRHVEAPDTATHRSGEGTFDANQIGTKGIDRFRRKPLAGIVESFLSRQHFLPTHFAIAAIGFGYCSIENQLGGSPNIGTNSVPFNEGNDGVFGYQ
jgi:hypothetical protein